MKLTLGSLAMMATLSIAGAAFLPNVDVDEKKAHHHHHSNSESGGGASGGGKHGHGHHGKEPWKHAGHMTPPANLERKHRVGMIPTQAKVPTLPHPGDVPPSATTLPGVPDLFRQVIMRTFTLGGRGLEHWHARQRVLGRASAAHNALHSPSWQASPRCPRQFERLSVPVLPIARSLSLSLSPHTHTHTHVLSLFSPP